MAGPFPAGSFPAESRARTAEVVGAPADGASAAVEGMGEPGDSNASAMGGGDGRSPASHRRAPAPWLPALATAVAVLGVAAVVLWQLHPSLLLKPTATAGGDTGAHFMMPAFFNTNLFPHLTGWDPDWYDGYPVYTFYFVLPDVLVAIASHVIGYDVAFKLGTVLGSVLLPVAAWALGRLFGLRSPVPAVLAAATLPFLFDPTWTIYGGNLFSTLAGEYSYSLSIVFLLVFVGFFARGVRTGRHRGWAALALAMCILAHVVPAVLALAAAAFLTLFELLPDRLRLHDDLPVAGADAPTPGRWSALWWSVSTTGLGLVLAAWWLVPFLLRDGYSTSMNYTKVTDYVTLFFPRADLWALVAAGVAVVVALRRRSRFGVLFAVLGGVSVAAVVFDPSRSLYNVRFLPLWFLYVYLMVGWLFGVCAVSVARWFRRERLARWAAPSPQHATVGDVAIFDLTRPRRRPAPPRWLPGAVAGPLVALVAALAVVIPPFVPSLANELPGIGVHPGANQVSVWANWNYSGYGSKSGAREYEGLMALMRRIGATQGCGRAMWEYNADENRFGTPEALMLLPYWTTGCIDSMEGLLFESSATTPYHFLNQAELSVAPSEAVVGLPYGPLTVHLGVEHLQLLGVRYFMAASPEVEQQADADPTLQLLATSGPWTSSYNGQPLSTTWKVYRVRHSAVVEPLTATPAVLSGVGQGQTSWLGTIGAGDAMTEGPSLRWYLDPAAWHVELTAGGLPTWPRVTAAEATRAPDHALPAVSVTDVRQGADSLSFHVSRLGVPVLVKISYFPNWHASGADGPWRATPNLMVVDPTSHDVTLSYGTTVVTTVPELVSALGVAVLVAMAGGWLLRRRRRRPRVG